MAISRRTFLGRGAAGVGSAAVALGPGSALARGGRSTAGFGDPVADKGGLIDLPRGFQYRVVQTADGDRLSNGAPVPDDFDGMIALQGRKKNTTVLVRNHELRPGDVTGGKSPVPQRNPYDPAAPGGTTAVVVGPDRRAIDSYVTSSGTLNNCAGGGTPWGTWITCEEDRTTGHGYAFEVDPFDPESTLSRTPIRDMGYFSHEAVDIDPRTGIAYLTEDDFRGRLDDSNPERDERSSFLYRYLPHDRSQRPGALQQGGTLQALAVEELPPGYDADFLSTGQRLSVVWHTVNPEEPHDDALAKGCVRFNRLEGTWFAGGAFWFDDTAGGEKRCGQIYRYIPATNTLELFYEGRTREEMDAPDNICITPWGDLWWAEDGDGEQRIMGITPDREIYTFARTRNVGRETPDGDASEFCGPTFSPDGRTFFVNIQDPGHTFAIWGPFARRNGGGGARRMAAAAPPRRYAPHVSPALAEAADRHGMTRLEAAAFERLGVALT